jgi:hypothetical protein
VELVWVEVAVNGLAEHDSHVARAGRRWWPAVAAGITTRNSILTLLRGAEGRMPRKGHRPSYKGATNSGGVDHMREV